MDGVQWKKSHDDPDQDGVTPFMPPMVEQQPVAEAVVPKRIYIRKEDV